MYITVGRCINLVQSMINSAVRKLAYGEYVFFRLWSKALIGKKKRNELVSSGGLNFDRIMFKHFMSRSAGFIKPINNIMGFIFYDKFRCIIPLDDTGVSSEVRRAYLKPKMGGVVIDVGAHYGFYSLHASELVGTEGVVLSFEPPS